MRRQGTVATMLCGILSLVLTAGTGSTVGAASYPFADDFESGLTEWTADPPWGETTAFYASPVYSVTDSPSTFYAAGTDAALSLGSSIDLTSAMAPVLRFKHRHQLEDGHDFGHVELSTDGGVSWSAPLASYTGGQATWAREQIDLSAAAGYNDVRIRFRIATDGTVNADGWYIDDVLIAEGPAAVTLATPSTVTPNTVELSWSASAEPGFLSYRLYRSSTSAFDWREANLVTEITTIGATTHTDITVVPKTPYFYKVMVVTSDELHSLSNEESAATPAGMDYPFLDDGEGGSSAWTADPPWALTTEVAFSGSHSWSDSPGGDYGVSIPSQSLTLVGPIDLTASTAPVLSFVHTWDFLSGDSGNVEVSTDGGSSWTPLAVYTAGSSGGWLRERFELDPFSFSNNVFVRFRITTSAADGADGWHVDDISVAESPTEVDPPILDQITSHSIRLTWARCNDLFFSHYAVFRSTAAGVGIKDTLVAEIPDQDGTTFTDTGLAVDTDYFYRVYAVSPYGTFSPDSPAESSAHTGGNPYPFTDGFEGSLDAWNLTGDWQRTDTDQYSGSWSLTDTPGTTYATSATSWAWTAIDLTGSTWPVLSFWDRYAFADTGDWGWVEVSTNGSTWTRVYSATLTRTAWARQQIDLSPWKTQPNLRIRFGVSTNYTGVDDGWYIDELSIQEHPGGGVPLPFFDGFEAPTGTGNWLTSAWAPSPDDPHSGLLSAASTDNGWISPRSSSAMVLADELDLSVATDPQLTFWLRGGVGDDGGFAAQVSTDGGVTWATLPGASIGQYWTAGWTRFQISLSGYLQSGLRFRLVATNGNYGGQSDLYVDDVSVEEMPQPVYLDPAVPFLKSVDLSWSESTLTDFDHYEVYRSTAANVTTANDLVFSSATKTDTSFTDTGLSIGATYYYKVFTFNTRNVATPSNERMTTTVPLTLPVVDPMENLDNWDATGTWGPDGTSPYAGSFSLADSPVDNYPVSTNTQILTAVNLTGSIWPVLTFWDRYAFADTGDWGWVEVSTNGSTWTRVYSATLTRTAWARQQIDLSPWKTQPNLRIRFGVSTNYTGVDDGWYIDELSIQEHPGGLAALPFLDGFETGTGAWLTSAWAPSPDDPNSGLLSAASTDNGWISPRSSNAMVLADELDLSVATDPQLTFWLRGGVGDDGGFAAQVSTDGGVTWATLPGASIGQYWTAGWTRFQVSLSGYLQSGLRFRFVNTNGNYGGQSDLYVDDVAIEEMPPPVTLNTPDQLTVSSMRLTWNDLNDTDFAAYALYRSETTTVDTSSTLVTTITDQTTTEFVDTDLQTRRAYYYRLYFVDTTSTYSPSNSTSAMTLGAALPFNDDFESDSGVWTFTGDWGPVVAGGVAGSTSLGDSPGDLAQNLDAYAVTGIDLSAASWPIVSFDERYDFGAHWGRFEISVNGGASWTILQAPNLDQTGWVRRSFDLSPWRGQAQVWIRFFVDANGNVPTDGWHIDNLFIGENPLAGSAVSEFFDGLEGGDGDWLNGSWTLTDDSPYAGSTAILDTINNRAANSDLMLVYARPVDLSGSTDPLLTFQVRGNLPDNNYFRTEVSTDQGLTWQNLTDVYIHDNWSSPTWARMQTSLAGYLVPDLRLRFRVYGNYGGDSNVFLDNISIGEQTPGAPTLNAPAWGASEPTVRPILVVDNAVDYQSDPMTYEYQVFDDPGLTSVVAQVPAVAGGIDTTSWTVDVDLLPDTQYWWRCRATDDSAHTGPWMDTSTFFVQLSNHPPTVPELLAPANGATLQDLNARLTWLESTDPDADAGDYVDSYRVQVDDDPSFASPEIDESGITLTEASGALSVSLGELSGSGALVTETRYYWRVAARDNNGLWSAWSSGPAHFVFGDDLTAPVCAIASPAAGATLTDTPILIAGTADDSLSGTDLVEVSTDGGSTWVDAVGDATWSHQWWPALSGDYQLSCRATDVAGNAGAASAPITVHAELDRTMTFTEATVLVGENAGTLDVTVTLSGARATEVNADLVVSGTAQPGIDFSDLPQQVRFFPGQTSLSFPLQILDDSDWEGNETIVIELTNPNLPDVTFGTNAVLTVTIQDDEVDPTTVIFADDFETGDVSGWSGSAP